MPHFTPTNGLENFNEKLFFKMQQVHPGLAELEFYEFCYTLENLTPSEGWESVRLEEMDELEQRVKTPNFFSAVKIKPIRDNRIVLDDTIADLTRILFKGLVLETYPPEWVNRHFYYDIRASAFFVRTIYITPEITALFGGQPYCSFEPTQKRLDPLQDIGYAEYAEANAQIDQAFLEIIRQYISCKGTPLLLSIVGPTAAGKSEITFRLRHLLESEGRTCTSIEMDNFMKDREFRDGKPTDSRVIHYEIFLHTIQNLRSGRSALTPKYDFILATSSHDLAGNLRPGQTPIEIQPAEVILLEGNFPFHIPEIARWIDLKGVYLADDAIRLKRKWRRDVDYRKKYDPAFLCNRYFRSQYFRNIEIYQPLMKSCEMVVDTTSAHLWVRPEIATILRQWTPALSSLKNG